MTDTIYFLHISEDRLSARLQNSATGETDLQLDPGKPLTSLLAEAGVVHGVHHDAILAAQALIDRGEALSNPLTIGTGTPPMAGRKGQHPLCTPVERFIEEIDEDGTPRQVALGLVPLVRVGEPLTRMGPAVDPQNGKDLFGKDIACPFPAEQVVVAGDLVTVDNDTGCLIAAASGYPAFSSIRKGMIEQVTLGVERLIRITPDRMQALLRVNPPPPGHQLPDRATILTVLDEEGIVFGRLKQAIDQCLERCSVEGRPQQAVIALGVLPINGKDAWLRFSVEVGSMPGKIMGNGEIDFRERNMFVGVNKDQLIAVRVPPSPGSPGQDIFGSPIVQTPGKDIVVKVTDDAAFDEASGEIRAVRAGVLSMVSEGSVKVCARQVISQDVDFATGNIVSRDALEIKGSIKPKFRVNALGDILIHGNIDRAQIRSDSNVVVRAGMLGDHAVIHARGDVDIQFVERGRIHAGGGIILRKNAYYCRLHANGSLVCDQASRVIASQLVAAGSLTVGTVGSNNAESSLLAAAVCPEQLQLYFELSRAVAEAAEAVEALQRRIGPDADHDELDELTETFEENKRQLNRLNLIVPKNREPADRGLSFALGCAVIVKGTVFAGTEIRLGNSRMVLPITTSNVSFRLQESVDGTSGDRPVIFTPNKR